MYCCGDKSEFDGAATSDGEKCHAVVIDSGDEEDPHAWVFDLMDEVGLTVEQTHPLRP